MVKKYLTLLFLIVTLFSIDSFARTQTQTRSNRLSNTKSPKAIAKRIGDQPHPDIPPYRPKRLAGTSSGKTASQDLKTKCPTIIRKCINKKCYDPDNQDYKKCGTNFSSIYNNLKSCVNNDISPVSICDKDFNSIINNFIQNIETWEKATFEATDECKSARAKLKAAKNCMQTALTHSGKWDLFFKSELKNQCGSEVEGGSSDMVNTFYKAGDVSHNIVKSLTNAATLQFTNKKENYKQEIEIAYNKYLLDQKQACGETYLDIPSVNQYQAESRTNLLEQGLKASFEQAGRNLGDMSFESILTKGKKKKMTSQDASYSASNSQTSQTTTATDDPMLENPYIPSTSSSGSGGAPAPSTTTTTPETETKQDTEQEQGQPEQPGTDDTQQIPDPDNGEQQPGEDHLTDEEAGYETKTVFNPDDPRFSEERVVDRYTDEEGNYVIETDQGTYVMGKDYYQEQRKVISGTEPNFRGGSDVDIMDPDYLWGFGNWGEYADGYAGGASAKFIKTKDAIDHGFLATKEGKKDVEMITSIYSTNINQDEANVINNIFGEETVNVGQTEDLVSIDWKTLVENHSDKLDSDLQTDTIFDVEGTSTDTPYEVIRGTLDAITSEISINIKNKIKDLAQTKEFKNLSPKEQQAMLDEIYINTEVDPITQAIYKNRTNYQNRANNNTTNQTTSNNTDDTNQSDTTTTVTSSAGVPIEVDTYSSEVINVGNDSVDNKDTTDETNNNDTTNDEEETNVTDINNNNTTDETNNNDTTDETNNNNTTDETNNKDTTNDGEETNVTDISNNNTTNETNILYTSAPILQKLNENVQSLVNGSVEESSTEDTTEEDQKI
jgi:hypothetical protein